MTTRNTLILAAFTVGLLGSVQAAAQEKWQQDRFMVGLGLYRPNVETVVRVDEAITGISGTLLNLERDLNLKDRETEVTLDAHFRFAKRHAIEFEYVKLARAADTNIGFEINYDGEIIAINEDVTTTFKTKVGRLGYRFSFINSDKMELSGSVGLHITDLTVGLNVVGEEAEFNEVTAPLPTLGVAWKYHFNDQLTFHIRGEWLDIKIDQVNGKLTSGIAELSWYPFDNFGASLGYNVWDLSVTATEASLTGEVEYKYNGPKLTLKARF